MVGLFGEKTSATNVAEFTVSEIAGALKRVVEEKFGYVRVRGEISGYRGAHASGHAYFALKDDKARLEAVIWRGSLEKLKFPPEEGMEVVAVGKLTTYLGSSKYQIVIEALEPTGVGALMTLLENRKKKFAEEGLFDEAKKKPLPYMPRIIGVVTSPTGAVIRDIIHRISDRFPLHVLVWPVRVQGETSGSEVAAAVEGFNALASGGLIPKPDLLIVARGGGSLEDLWGFNDEAVVRAVYASDLPVISAVGHETDWTLIDYVADWRAPTPTGAAEKAVPVKLDLEVSVASLGARLRKGLARSFDFHQQKLRAARRGLPTVDQLFALPRRGFDEISSRLQRALCASYDKKRFSFHALHLRLSPRLLKSEKAQRHTKEYTARLHRAFMRSVEKKRAALELACRLLKSTSYQNILERGFVLALGQDHKPIKRLAQFPESGQINLRFFDGDICVATQEPVSPTRSKHRKIKSPIDDQGTLF
ncbi:exodeoxyribonuclease 7 large subunit [Bartonella elizabethae Re6043vi]|uniref:Exodeoxyribonuclease 7 large subunit n=2 Tax=Bartonella elizabethae TaxID=807 RepID=J0RH73_BAREL|nr:exodeoxyribonuclease VII large subunit [Bartonella elizabethae]EJF84931.1 exodeoxyribonuclease 7 large subunit [Bartonella elizabethae Re6043vi]EJF95334.1 exodeoxyribonuclease 7 large subunit [Bartonella elizabethae F9251 = ATCC 49927]VEJ41654.1 Exodeoxyribonuclease 7 large subunit [Bartonella elizabethae]